MITALLSVPLLPACARLRAREDNERIVRSKIEAEIARSLDATKRQDIQAFMDGFAPEFEVEATDGDQGTLGVLRANTLREWAIIPATLAISMRIDSLKTEGPRTAVVFTDQRWERLMLERDGVTRDTVVTTQRHREIWRRGTVGWRRSKVTELGGTVMVNGKPYP
jgi:hypothetical protein